MPGMWLEPNVRGRKDAKKGRVPGQTVKGLVIVPLGTLGFYPGWDRTLEAFQ